jgi:DNA-binding NarL/FixJ family response regulator
MAGAENAEGLGLDTIKVAVVEDDDDIRQGLSDLLDSSPGFTCVAKCRSAEEALVGLPERQPDVTLMDIGLPGMSGIECIAELKWLLPGTQVMMLTVFEDHDRIFDSLKAGAAGYLLKKEPPDVLLQSIKELHEGGSPMSNQIARRVVEEFQKTTRPTNVATQLTVREREVLLKLSRGYLYKEIAQALDIALETVRTHVRNIYTKLHVRSRTQALNKAFPKHTRRR